MDAIEIFISANTVLLNIVRKIKDGQWAMPVPAEMSWQPNQSLRDIVNYHTYDDAWVEDVLAGKTIAEVGEAYDYLRVSADSLVQYEKFNALAIKAARAFRDFDRVVHLSYGDYSAGKYLTHITLYRGLRIFDIATLIGAEVKVPEELVRGLWEIVEPKAQTLRDMHVIGAELPVPANASLLDRLLAKTGRTRNPNILY